MATQPSPGRGAVVTYLNPDVMHPSVYVRDVVIGTHRDVGRPERELGQQLVPGLTPAEQIEGTGQPFESVGVTVWPAPGECWL